jgi:hypothetical protein
VGLWEIARRAEQGRGKPFSGPAQNTLLGRLKDPSSAVRIQAAGALADMGERYGKAALPVLAAELNSEDWNTVLHAARTVQMLGADAKTLLPSVRDRLGQVREHEGKEMLAQFVRYALEGTLREPR